MAVAAQLLYLQMLQENLHGLFLVIFFSLLAMPAVLCRAILCALSGAVFCRRTTALGEHITLLPLAQMQVGVDALLA